MLRGTVHFCVSQPGQANYYFNPLEMMFWGWFTNGAGQGQQNLVTCCPQGTSLAPTAALMSRPQAGCSQVLSSPCSSAWGKPQMLHLRKAVTYSLRPTGASCTVQTKPAVGCLCPSSCIPQAFPPSPPPFSRQPQRSPQERLHAHLHIPRPCCRYALCAAWAAG